MNGRFDNGLEYQQLIENGQFSFHLFSTASSNLTYAFYLKKDGIITVRTWYSDSIVFSSELQESGSYQAVVFTKNREAPDMDPTILEAVPISYDRALDAVKIEASYQNHRLEVFFTGDMPPNCTKISFELFRDGILISQSGWVENRRYNWEIIETGCYLAKCCVECEGQRLVRKSDPVVILKPKTISIFGSCVSRDVLEFFPPGQVTLKNYIARQSIVSAMSKPISIEDHQVDLSSSFQKRMVLCDMKKDWLDRLRDDPSDYLLLDLIDERFPLIKINDSYCTASNEYKSAFQKKKMTFRRYIKSLKDGDVILEGTSIHPIVRDFCSSLLTVYSPGQIILHRALMTVSFRDETGVHPFDRNTTLFNLRINCILSWMYDQIQIEIPGIRVIDEMEGTVADFSHKWGLAPMHYEKAYYLRILKQLYEIMS